MSRYSGQQGAEAHSTRVGLGQTASRAAPHAPVKPTAAAPRRRGLRQVTKQHVENLVRPIHINLQGAGPAKPAAPDKGLAKPQRQASVPTTGASQLASPQLAPGKGYKFSTPSVSKTNRTEHHDGSSFQRPPVNSALRDGAAPRARVVPTPPVSASAHAHSTSSRKALRALLSSRSAVSALTTSAEVRKRRLEFLAKPERSDPTLSMFRAYTYVPTGPLIPLDGLLDEEEMTEHGNALLSDPDKLRAHNKAAARFGIPPVAANGRVADASSGSSGSPHAEHAQDQPRSATDAPHDADAASDDEDQGSSRGRRSSTRRRRRGSRGGQKRRRSKARRSSASPGDDAQGTPGTASTVSMGDVASSASLPRGSARPRPRPSATGALLARGGAATSASATSASAHSRRRPPTMGSKGRPAQSVSAAAKEPAPTQDAARRLRWSASSPAPAATSASGGRAEADKLPASSFLDELDFADLSDLDDLDSLDVFA